MAKNKKKQQQEVGDNAPPTATQLASERDKMDKDRKEREEGERKKARAAIHRAIKHLHDWQHRLTEDGYTAMAAEIQGVANDLATPACLLGGTAAATFKFGGDSWSIQGVS